MSGVKDILNQALRDHQSGRSVKALGSLDALIASNLAPIDAYLIKGSILRAIKRLAAAEVCYQQALFRFPNNRAAMGNYANLLSDLKRFDDSERYFNRVLSFFPDDLSTIRNLGLMYYHSDQPQKSLECFEKIYSARPDDDDARWHIALTKLQLGKFEEGWQDYEVRMKTNKEVVKVFPSRRWLGEPIENKTLFIYLEQGFGDVIQFTRYIPMLLERNVNVLLQTKRPLKRLLETLKGVTFVDEKTVPKQYDYYCSLLSLPANLKLSSEEHQQLPAGLLSIPDVDENNALPSKAKKKVAIAWGSKLKPKDRTCPLPLLSFLAFDPDVEVYSIQFDDAKDDIEKNHFTSFITDLSPRIKDFYDTAQYLKQMDLVVSVDSSPIHLAGTLGVKTFGLLLHYSDWRWLYEREDTPLYPSVTLFRQHEPDNWGHPIAALKEKFAEWKEEN